RRGINESDICCSHVHKSAKSSRPHAVNSNCAPRKPWSEPILTERGSAGKSLLGTLSSFVTAVDEALSILQVRLGNVPLRSSGGRPVASEPGWTPKHLDITISPMYPQRSASHR